MITIVRCFVSVLFFISFSLATLAQGLRFVGSEEAINNRTSLDLFAHKHPQFSDSLVIAFELALYPEKEIGYIFRLKSLQSKTIFNLFYDGQGGDLVFKLNEEGRKNITTITVNRAVINNRWFRVKIHYHLTDDAVSLTIHNQTIHIPNVQMPDIITPTIMFGRSEHIIDVPSFAIRNLSVEGRKKYEFPLSEANCTDVHNAKRETIGTVINPNWLIQDSYRWHKEVEFASAAVAGYNYWASRKEILYFNADTLHSFNLWSKQTSSQPFVNKCPTNLVLGMNFIHPATDQLYLYEVFDEYAHGAPAVAVLDIDQRSWTSTRAKALPTQLHHHGGYLDSVARKYSIFGGFGSMHYNNLFHDYDLHTEQWMKRPPVEGTMPCPRYFSSVGHDANSQTVYIFGGMGNESGDQSVGRNYFYDLHKVNLADNTASKLWEIKIPGISMVPIRGMIFPDDKHFYTLCYPESLSASYLRLYRFSIADGSYEILGDTIPIRSDKITTNANLFYADELNKLIVTVQEFDDDIRSVLKVYTLAAPPITESAFRECSVYTDFNYTWLVLIGICIVVLAVANVVYYKKRAQRIREAQASAHLETEVMAGVAHDDYRPNSVYLFGEFMVRNSQNKDITYLLSAKLKQVLLLILKAPINEGISTLRLSNLLWPDKEENKVKNSRGVTINHLRKVLSELVGIELVYDNRCYKIVVSESFYCDYLHCMNIIADNNPDSDAEFVRIVSRGKFLSSLDEPLFDSFKEKTEKKMEPYLHRCMMHCYEADDMQATIKASNALFAIDPLSEEALVYHIKALKRLRLHDEALIRFNDFAREYKRTFGEECPHQLKSL